MKITSELALSQIKLNKKRSIGTIFAIVLSTAIMTALACFATSANHMLIGFLGEDYGEYGATYRVIIAIPVGLLCLLIAFMSITCISNIFATSSYRRIQEFGIIKCVGGTRKQIKEIVVFESLWLSIAGIPVGLLSGTLIGFVGVGITSHYVTNFNEISKSIIMRPFDASLSFYISGWTYVFASLVSFIIVIRSASKPAKTVGKITAIQCVKGLAGDNKISAERAKDGILGKLFGYEGALSFKNVKRNKSGYKASIRSLRLGLVLFIMLGGLASQAKSFIKFMTPKSKEMMVDFCSVIDSETMANGEEKEIYRVPILPEQYNEISDRLNQFDENEVYGIGRDSITYTGIIDAKFTSNEFLQQEKLVDAKGRRKVSIYSTNDALYEKLCARASVPIGSNLIINSFSYNNHGVVKNIKPFNEDIDKVTLITAEGEKTELAIAGILTEENLEEEGFYEIMPDPIRIIVPRAKVRYFDWFCATSDEAGFSTYARSVLDDYYPILTEDSYAMQGYTVRISRVDNMAKALNVAIVLVEFVMYGFVILLMLIGFTSVISTLVINIKIRSREFAVLKSIGMTKNALKKMLYCESLLCLARAAVPGIILGLLIPFAMNLAIRQMFPILFHVPWVNIGVGILMMTAIVMCITFVEVEREKDKSIIDIIRMDIV